MAVPALPGARCSEQGWVSTVSPGGTSSADRDLGARF